MRPKKRILILTASVGFGHLSAALSIRQHLSHDLKQDYQIEIIDFLTYCNKFINNAIKKSYFASLRYAPTIYKYIFKSTDKWPKEAMHLVICPLISRKILRLMTEKKPDIVISTYPIWNYCLKKESKRLKKVPKLITIITDSIKIHHTWFALDHADAYIVTDEDTKSILQKNGIKNAKIFAYGFPLRRQFFQQFPREKTLKSVNLSPDKFTILYLLNNNVTRREEKILALLAKKKCNFQMIMVVGGNKNFIRKLNHLPFAFPVKIFDWSNEISKLMQCSDLIITKAGGSSIAESIQCGKPTLISATLPQEEGNTLFISRHKIGQNMQNLGPEKSVNEIINLADFHNEKYQKMLSRVKKYYFSNLSPKISAAIKKI